MTRATNQLQAPYHNRLVVGSGCQVLAVVRPGNIRYTLPMTREGTYYLPSAGIPQFNQFVRSFAPE